MRKTSSLLLSMSCLALLVSTFLLSGSGIADVVIEEVIEIELTYTKSCDSSVGTDVRGGKYCKCSSSCKRV